MRVSLLSLLLLAGCSSPPPPRAPAGAAPKVAEAAPAERAPNTLRDRRSEPGVRAPAKPLVLEGPRSAKCGKLAKGTDETDVLGGRFRVRAPAGAHLLTPRPDEPALEEESKIVANAPKLAMAMVAHDTFQLDPDLYEGDAPVKPLDVEAGKFLKEKFGPELEITPVEIGKMRAYAGRPPHPNAPPGKDTALVLALLVADEDGALSTLSFYVRGETVRNATGDELVGCTRLAERVASSLVPGSRRLERAAGRREVAELSPTEALAVTVPADWVAVRGKASTRLTKLRPLSLYPGSIVVAVVDGKEAPPKAGAERTVPGKLLGRPTEWRGKALEKAGVYVAVEPVEGGKVAEVSITAMRQERALDELRAVAETLAVVKR